MGNALVRFENGASLSIEASWAVNVREKELQETRLMGDLGGLVHHNVDNEYVYEVETITEKDGELDVTCLRCAEKEPDPKQTAMFHFADCITKEQPHMCTGREGLILMKILDAIYKSAASGEPVQIDNA